ncbi:HCP-like protein, partial [Aureobasidium melanogenum]
MPLRDVLKKRSNIQGDATSTRSTSSNSLSALPNPIPEFTFMRTTTHEQEVIVPPSYPGDEAPRAFEQVTPEKKRRSIFRKSSANLVSSTASNHPLPSHSEEKEATTVPPVRPKNERKLSERLHFGRSRGLSRSESSSHVPSDLGDAPQNTPAPLDPPDAKGRVKETETKENKMHREAQWEKRATMMALKNPILEAERSESSEKKGHRRSSSLEEGEADIQEAIRLHEGGDLERSTQIFGRLADPNGANNPLCQVLYGLALRHGWGITPSADAAIHYLSLAASNSAAIESAALSSGSKAGGEAKGELVLAIFELANCFRYGWGIKVDKVAARNYYEVAANLGDPDALEEAAWCYMEGFGGPKDKFKAAQYLRLAEGAGRKSVGNSWIWKDKYSSSTK